MAQFLDYTGLGHFKDKNDALYAKATDLSNLSDVVAQKANIDGSYESMTVGNAEQLVSSVGIEDETPYNFRTSGGSVDIGDREELNAVVGGTVCWNQLLDGSADANWSANNATKSFSDGVCTFTASAKDGNVQLNVARTEKDHVYLAIVDIKTTTATNSVALNWYGGNYEYCESTTNWQTISAVNKRNASNNNFKMIISDRRTSGWDAIQVKKFMLFDLTAMFGSTIADYIYALEQSDTGAGVAYFRKMFPKPYYAYNSGELLSVQTSAHKMVGFNAYNPETGTAKVVGGNQYQITGAYTALSLDGTVISPDSNGKFTPSANGTLTVTGGNNTTTCVHLVWDGERNGEYEPYEAHEYALDDITLRGILKLDANNNLYADGDRYLPDGTVERRYAILNLGEKAWTMTALSGGRSAFTTPYSAWSVMPNCSSTVLTDAINNILERQVVQNASAWGSDVFLFTEAQGVLPANSFAMIFDSSKYASVDAFVSDMVAKNGQLVYAMKVPTTETADPYQQTQIVDDFGTEEFVDAAVEANERDVAIPVGHETFYQNNLKAKLEMAPNSPDGDGLYVVQQTNGKNEYVLLVIPTELPTAPTDDGTYVLKITVSDGTVAKAWVEEV